MKKIMIVIAALVMALTGFAQEGNSEGKSKKTQEEISAEIDKKADEKTAELTEDLKLTGAQAADVKAYMVKRLEVTVMADIKIKQAKRAMKAAKDNYNEELSNILSVEQSEALEEIRNKKKVAKKKEFKNKK